MNSNERKPNPTRQTKTPYRSPRLRVYGDLRRLTRMQLPAVKGGARADQMMPQTRL